MHLALLAQHARHAVASFDKQLHLADLVGKADWHFNMAMGLLSFEDRYLWKVQVLGTESEATGTWLWAWANHASNIPRSVLKASTTLRQWGEQHNLPELTMPEVSLDNIDGHFFALLGSGVCQANAYYRAPYPGGAAFLLIKDDLFPRHADEPLARIARVFPQAISSIDIHDHREALLGYLDYHGLAGTPEGDRIVLLENGEPTLIATFDEYHRLTRLDLTINPAQP